MPWDTIISHSTTAIAALLGAAIGSILTHRFNKKRDHLDLKRDVLRRVMGYRWHLTNTFDNKNGGPLFTVLNEIPFVFSGEVKVEQAFEDFRKSAELKNQEDNSVVECLILLLKEMAHSCNVNCQNWNDGLLKTPISPG